MYVITTSKSNFINFQDYLWYIYISFSMFNLADDYIIQIAHDNINEQNTGNPS